MAAQREDDRREVQRLTSRILKRHKRTAVPRYGDVPIVLKVVAKNHSIS
jgi:hypothetical protein